ncbi:uncharacterized protein MONOS_6664 [Monocercomonoides exilis]|uniref:uncharacterized protein n=1 Tax=Monocercomonoides exilis TaxID=2049356 RepID=UPI00355AA409|nr:hypothetical protein MONOS_6664 [Monocercomonoides exilis]|eukprot:MONOS_6664.1-p1 / transcript=MONOS_6664.1 / gene=MONOS_6664 / organism=Monocercomonoides_exilis_PA203 / gene_product=unspecified product / transcript_product=unspecified product / location=Mono_scaffold00214:27134-27433(-) / protein_length=81 / sequence_SO=supercontig / SO=protein_coding / is_pseudo=false
MGIKKYIVLDLIFASILLGCGIYFLVETFLIKVDQNDYLIGSRLSPAKRVLKIIDRPEFVSSCILIAGGLVILVVMQSVA